MVCYNLALVNSTLTWKMNGDAFALRYVNQKAEVELMTPTVMDNTG